MTCILGWTNGHTVLLAGDSGGTKADIKFRIKHPKVFLRTGEDKTIWGFGFSGSFTVAQILQYKLALPSISPKEDIRGIIVRDFIPGFQKLCDEASTIDDKGADGKQNAADIIIAVCGQIFIVDVDFSVLEHDRLYCGLGNGAPYALGVLHQQLKKNPPQTPEDCQGLLLDAISTSTEFIAGIQEPFHVITIPYPIIERRKTSRSK